MSKSNESVSIVDAHHHLWDLSRHDYPWLSTADGIVGDPSAIRRDYLPRDYLGDVGPADLVGTVHLDGGFDPENPVGETRFAQEIADLHGFPNAVVGGIALDSGSAERTIEAHLAFPLLRGVRQIVAWHETPRLSYVQRPDMMSDTLWRRNFGLLRRHNLSFDLQLYPSQMSDAARLAADHPDTPIILDQAGMPVGFQNGIPQDWREGMARLAVGPNVSVKVSGFAMLHPEWTLEEIRPLVATLIDLFGTDRIMFASNFTVDKLFRPFSEILAAFQSCIVDLSPDERHEILAGNAQRIYRMTPFTQIPQDGQLR